MSSIVTPPFTGELHPTFGDHSGAGLPDALVRLAATVTGAPTALAVLIALGPSPRAGGAEAATEMTEETQARVVGRHHDGPLPPFCLRVAQRVAVRSTVLAVSDARGEDALAHDLVSDDPSVRAYFGVPVHDRAGHAIGSVCVFDTRPRKWSAAQRAVLTDVARTVAEVLNQLRRRDAPAGDAARDDVLLDLATDLVTTADGDGVITYVNQAWCRAFGYARHEVLGRRVVDLVVPEERSVLVGLARRLQSAEARESAQAFEVTAVGVGGRRVVCRGHAAARYRTGIDGRRVCIETRAVYQHVSADGDHAAARAQLLAALESTSEFVGIARADGHIVYLNRAGRRLLRLPEDTDLSTWSAAQFHPPATRTRLMTEGLPAAVRDGVWRGDGELLAVDGTRIPVSMAVSAQPGVPSDPEPLFTAIMRDQRDVVAAARAQQVSEARFRAMFDSAAIGVSVISRAGIILQANRALEEMLGYAPGALVGRYAPSLSPAADAEITRLPVGAVRSGTVPSTTVEKRFYTATGALRTVALTVSRVEMHDGEDAILGLLRDVTDQRAAEAALQESEERYRRLIDLLPDGVMKQAGGIVRFVNRAMADLVGADDPTDLIGRPIADLLHPDDRAASLRRIQQATRLGAADPGDPVAVRRILRRDGTTVTCEVVGTPIDVLGEVGTLAVVRDVSERRRQEQALRENEARLALIYHHVSDVMFFLRVERGSDGAITGYRCESANAPAAAMRGWPLAAFVGRPLQELVPAAQYRVVRERVDAAVRTGTPQQVEYTADGVAGPIVLEAAVTSVHDGHGLCTHVLVVHRDVTARREAESALRQSEATLRAMLENVRVLAITLDTEGRITFANDALLSVTGWSRAEVLGTDWFARFAVEADALRRLFARMTAGEDTIPHFESEIRTRDGRRRLVVWDNTVLYDGEGRVIGSASLGQDVTDQRAMERRLATLSERDELTGLLNRRGFVQRVEDGMRRARRRASRDVLLYLDLDHFKPINDTYGHAAGDEALRSFSEVLQLVVRETDAVGRLGGDEFAIYATGFETEEAAVAMVHRLEDLVAAHNAQRTAEGRPYAVAFSLGIAWVEPGDTRDTLFARADAALYTIKRSRSAPRGVAVISDMPRPTVSDAVSDTASHTTPDPARPAHDDLALESDGHG